MCIMVVNLGTIQVNAVTDTVFTIVEDETGLVVHKLWQQTAILNLSVILDGNSNRRKLWTYLAHFMKRSLQHCTKGE